MLRTAIVVAGLLLCLAVSAHAADVVPHGKVFTNFTVDLRSEEDRGEDPLTAFDLKRVYLGAKGKFSDDLSYKVTYDVTLIDEKYYQAFAKVAQLSWKDLVPRSTLTFGLTGTHTFKLTESAWGHRGIEKAGPDRWKLRSSADQGLSVVSKPSDALQIQAGVFNGEGYKKREADGFKQFQVRPVYAQSGVTVSPYFDFTRFDADDETKNETLVGGFVGYAKQPFSVGADVLLLSHGDTKEFLVWGFVRYSVNDQTEVFVRADHYDPDQDADGDQTQLVIIGAVHKPAKGVEVALDFQLRRHDGANESALVFHNTYGF